MDLKEKQLEIIKHYGLDRQLDMLIEECAELIDLVEPDILWQEKHLTERASDKMKAIIAAYRVVRPKEGK